MSDSNHNEYNSTQPSPKINSSRVKKKSIFKKLNNLVEKVKKSTGKTAKRALFSTNMNTTS